MPALVIVVFGLILISRFIDPALLGMRENPYLSVIILQLLIFALPSIFFCKLRSGGDSENGKNKYNSRLRLNMFNGDHVLFLVFAGFVLILASSVVKVGVLYLFPLSQTSVTPVSYMQVYTTDGALDTIYSILAFAVLPAVTEEFLFRSVIVAEYEKCGVACAVVLNALMFSMLHFNLAMFFVYFVSGIILTFVMYTTRSVFASMAVHLINNIFNIYFENYMWKMISRPQNTVIFMFVFILLLLVFMILMFGEAERIYHNYGVMNASSAYVPKKSGRGKKKGTQTFYDAVFAPPFILLVLFFVAAALIL